MRPSPRALFAVVALPLVMMLERCAWYATSSVSWMPLDDHDWTMEQIRLLWDLQGGLSVVALMVAGVVALGVGPLPVLLLGLVLSCAAWSVAPLVGPDTYPVVLCVAMVGSSFVRPALWATLLLPLARPRESGRLGACLLLYGAANVGAAVGPRVAGTLQFEVGVDAVFAAGAALTGLALLVAIGLVFAWMSTADEERAAGPGPSSRFEPRVLATIAVLGLLLVLPWAGSMTGFQAVFRAIRDLPFVGNAPSLWREANPALIVFVTALLSSTCLLAAMFRRTVPALLLAGPGMVVLGIGVILMAFEPVRLSPWTFGGAFALMTLGELAGPALLSRLGGDVHWRLTTLVVALWTAPTAFAYTTTATLANRELLPDPFLFPVPFAALLIPLGLVVTVAAIPLQRRIFDPPGSARDPAPGAVVAPHQL